MKLSICADILYGGAPFAEKLAAIRENGFDTVEFWSWHDKPLDLLAEQVASGALRIACFCLDSRDEGLMRQLSPCLLNGGRPDLLRAAAEESIETANRLGVKVLIATVGELLPGVSREAQLETVCETLSGVKELFEKSGVTLVVEPINHYERPAYLCPNVRDVVPLLAKVDSPNIKLLYDVYHQAMEDDFHLAAFKEAIPLIGHVHMADVPGRHEPGTGSVDYRAVRDALQRAGYAGYVGAEFVPSGSEAEAFAATRQLLVL